MATLLHFQYANENFPFTIIFAFVIIIYLSGKYKIKRHIFLKAVS